MRRNCFSLCLVVWFAGPVPADAQKKTAPPKYRLSVVTDHKDGLYDVGEKAGFTITLHKDGRPVSEGKLSYVLNNDGVAPVVQGVLDITAEPMAVYGKLDKPGFLRCRVTYRTPDNKSLSAMAAAGIDPLAIPASLPVPDDFDAFWAEQKKKLATVPMNPKLTPVATKAKGVEAFDVQIGCLGGKPVSGYFCRPTDSKPKSLAAILYVHGAGVRSSSLGNAVSGAEMGMLSMDINAHGIPNGKPGKYYSDLSRGDLRGYPSRGRDNRNECYFRGMFLRLVRAIDFLTSQPEWDGKVLVVTGHSQGGGQSIVAAGLDDRVSFFAAGVPAICDHSGRAVGRINGWPKLVPTDAAGKPDPKSLQAARYFDAMNFAARTKAEALFSVGFIDVTCPPTSVYATYNNLSGKKRILNELLMGHAAPAHIRSAFTNAIKEHADRAKGK